MDTKARNDKAYRPATWEPAFLAALRELPSITKAAADAGVSLNTVNSRRRRHPIEFEERVQEARMEGIRKIEQIAVERASGANPDMAHVRWMLSRLLPDEYGDRKKVDMNVNEPINVNIKVATPTTTGMGG